jgi:MFS family permease
MKPNEWIAGKGRLLTPFVLLLLFILFLVEFVKGALLLAVLPVYSQSVLGVSAFMIGWTLTVQYIGDNLLRTPSGWLIDRIGYRFAMLGGVLLAFIAVWIMASARDYMWVLAASALLGLGTAPLWPCVIAGITEAAGKQSEGTVMGMVYMAWLAGVGLGPVVITLFTSGGYAPAFRLLLGLSAAAAAAAFFLPVRPRGEKGREPAAKRYRGGGLKTGRMERIGRYFAEVRSSLTVSPLLFPAMFAQNFALGLLAPILTLYAKTVLKLTPGQYSLFLLAGGAVSIVFFLPVGKLVDRWGVRPFLSCGFALGGAVMLAFPFFHTTRMLYLMAVCLGAGYGLIIPSWNALIASAVPEDKRGAVWGFFLTIEGLGMVTGPLVSGRVWDAFGPRAPFLLSGSVLLALLVLQAYLAAPRKTAVTLS